MIGRAHDSYPDSFNGSHDERVWWIGKPWRRLELFVADDHYRGELVSRVWTISAHLRVLPSFGLSLSATGGERLDYSEEQP